MVKLWLISMPLSKPTPARSPTVHKAVFIVISFVGCAWVVGAAYQDISNDVYSLRFDTQITVQALIEEGMAKTRK